EEHAEPPAEQGQGENPPKCEFRAETEKDERRDCKHDSCGERFARRASGLDDVVFKNGGTAEGAKNAYGEHRNGDRSGNGKPGAQANVDGHGAEQQPEERAKDDRPDGEFLWAFFGRYIAAEFAWRRRGTPCLFAPPRLFAQ